MTPALEATGLGMRYRRTWALRDCSAAVPSGRVAALVGPNGAGKTTLLHLAVGMLTPTAGEVRIFGRPVRESMERIAFLAQSKPLYAGFRVEEMLRFGRELNPRWDGAAARRRLADLGIPLERRVGGLSGGQRTQVALTVALAKRPDLLVLDEPLADLDPLARDDVMRGLMEAVAETGLTVLLSSHVVSELEGVCDWLVVVNGGRVQVSGDIDELVAGHRLLTGPAGTADALAARLPVISRGGAGRQATLLVRDATPPLDPRWTARPVNLEETVLAYLRAPDQATLPRPSLASAR
ncbi:ABC transporter ATP-binding protein [Streptosporangium roseum]|uniref:ABC transporter, ATP-binding protein n=1 Tax=Streptosporangium roseum (strain ATCC 12428 / DSM 43021 / JCM 3005 / KCTC 9067 / NCIMB 10171 / NRRL 2505 / NI 9100) TaxID=479432 RepID=D2B3L9_STRRD|nr:ABC transporter ATP-binding protein [Streptosporangium roseum]ACZ89304.1 ABC transporter, ATP-binding protein [Streptosporangium roseum DSM 43021]